MATPGPRIDPRVDAYIAKAAPFARPILERLRAAFHVGCPDVEETLKWGHPAFVRQGILGGMMAFKAHVGFAFWRAAEMADPEGLFTESTSNGPTQSKLTSVEDLPSKRVLVQYVREAVRVDGLQRAAKPKPAKRAAPRAPKWFADAVASSPRAKATWDAFPPSCKREYLEWVTEAKREETRERRLAQTLEWLAEGKRRNWKYERG